jgi:Mob1/phocein family
MSENEWRFKVKKMKNIKLLNVIYEQQLTLFISRYEYFWQDGVNYKKPTPLPAPRYIEHLMDWVDGQINNEEIFPVTTNIPFPRSFQTLTKKILTRLFRVFVHVYIHHFDRFVLLII